MLKTTFLFAALLAYGLPSFGGPSVTVLGLPLGGKMLQNIKSCPGKTSESQTLCWNQAPKPSPDGSRRGRLDLAEASSPDWGIYSTEAHLTKDGVLRSLLVRTIDGPKNRWPIIESIRRRFGEPELVREANDPVVAAIWDRPEIYIYMLCGEDCRIEFQSAEEREHRKEVSAALKKKEAARPLAP